MKFGELQDWLPAATLERLRLRNEILFRIRAYFRSGQVMEVETPLLSRAAATDPVLQSFEIQPRGGSTDAVFYLHTSPEFAMKRLLAAGCGPIYQICKVFRREERGRLHNPEFSMLEWYRPDYDHHDLMDEVEDFLRCILKGLLEITGSVRLSYSELFQRHAGVNRFTDNCAQLRSRLLDHGFEPPPGLSMDRPDGWRDLLLTHVIEPQLPEGIVFVYDFPVSQAALARLRQGEPAVAERFEVYLNGVELGNGFHELTDVGEQRQRMKSDLQRRQDDGLPQVVIDQHFLAALHAGLPDCAGVAVGLDRLIMLAANASSIQEVISFPIDRA